MKKKDLFQLMVSDNLVHHDKGGMAEPLSSSRSHRRGQQKTTRGTLSKSPKSKCSKHEPVGTFQMQIVTVFHRSFGCVMIHSGRLLYCITNISVSSCKLLVFLKKNSSMPPTLSVSNVKKYRFE